jgi:transcription termination factor Rho
MIDPTDPRDLGRIGPIDLPARPAPQPAEAPAAAPAPEAAPGAPAADGAEPVKRKRGRPRKNPLPADAAPVDPAAAPVKRRPGRPRKNPLPEAPAPAAPAAPAATGTPARESASSIPSPRSFPRLPGSILATASPSGTEYVVPPANEVKADDSLGAEPPPELAPAKRDPYASDFAVARRLHPAAHRFEERKPFTGAPGQARFGGGNGFHGNRPGDRRSFDQRRGDAAGDRALLAKTLELSDLQKMNGDELRALAEHFRVPAASADPDKLDRDETIFAIVRANAHAGGSTKARGVAEVSPREGHAFLRTPEAGFMARPQDIYLAGAIVRTYQVRSGDSIEGDLRPPRDRDRFMALANITRLNGDSPTAAKENTPFERLCAIYPDERIPLEGDATARLVDLLTPAGKGQRALVLVPPGADQGAFFRMLANAWLAGAPGSDAMYLSLDACPEDVTKLTRSLGIPVAASTIEEAPEKTVQMCEFAVEMGKRKVEKGADAVLFIDSLSRLAAAYAALGDPRSRGNSPITKVKRLFGAARNIEGGGSLTIFAAVDATGDDEVLRAVRPAANWWVKLTEAGGIDLSQCGSRGTEALVHEDERLCIKAVKESIAGKDPAAAEKEILAELEKAGSNLAFLLSVKK